MAVSLRDLNPGDVLVTATADRAAWWLRLRSKLMGEPSLHNHVAMFTHLDNTGRPRGLEGRPSGFGWANLDRYLDHPATVSNAGQPLRTEQQRMIIVAAATDMLGRPYDWAAIIAFAAATAGLPFLAREWPDGGVPSHVVCSSSIDYLYESVGWNNPGGYRKTRGTDVDDWSSFILDNPGWAVV